MFGNAPMEVSGCITDIICITQITCKFINNALLIHNTRLNFFRLKMLFQFFAHKNWLQNDANLSAEITLFPTDCISGYRLIFEGKNYSDRVEITGFLFWPSCSILDRHINGGIHEANYWIINSEKYRA